MSSPAAQSSQVCYQQAAKEAGKAILWSCLAPLTFPIEIISCLGAFFGELYDERSPLSFSAQDLPKCRFHRWMITVAEVGWAPETHVLQCVKECKKNIHSALLLEADKEARILIEKKQRLDRIACLAGFTSSLPSNWWPAGEPIEAGKQAKDLVSNYQTALCKHIQNTEVENILDLHPQLQPLLSACEQATGPSVPLFEAGIQLIREQLKRSHTNSLALLSLAQDPLQSSYVQTVSTLQQRVAQFDTRNTDLTLLTEELHLIIAYQAAKKTYEQAKKHLLSVTQGSRWPWSRGRIDIPQTQEAIKQFRQAVRDVQKWAESSPPIRSREQLLSQPTSCLFFSMQCAAYIQEQATLLHDAQTTLQTVQNSLKQKNDSYPSLLRIYQAQKERVESSDKSTYPFHNQLLQQRRRELEREFSGVNLDGKTKSPLVKQLKHTATALENWGNSLQVWQTQYQSYVAWNQQTDSLIQQAPGHFQETTTFYQQNIQPSVVEVSSWKEKAPTPYFQQYEKCHQLFLLQHQQIQDHLAHIPDTNHPYERDLWYKTAFNLYWQHRNTCNSLFLQQTALQNWHTVYQADKATECARLTLEKAIRGRAPFPLMERRISLSRVHEAARNFALRKETEQNCRSAFQKDFLVSAVFHNPSLASLYVPENVQTIQNQKQTLQHLQTMLTQQSQAKATLDATRKQFTLVNTPERTRLGNALLGAVGCVVSPFSPLHFDQIPSTVKRELWPEERQQALQALRQAKAEASRFSDPPSTPSLPFVQVISSLSRAFQASETQTLLYQHMTELQGVLSQVGNMHSKSSASIFPTLPLDSYEPNVLQQFQAETDQFAMELTRSLQTNQQQYPLSSSPVTKFLNDQYLWLTQGILPKWFEQINQQLHTLLQNANNDDQWQISLASLQKLFEQGRNLNIYANIWIYSAQFTSQVLALWKQYEQLKASISVKTTQDDPQFEQMVTIIQRMHQLSTEWNQHMEEESRQLPPNHRDVSLVSEQIKPMCKVPQQLFRALCQLRAKLPSTQAQSSVQQQLDATRTLLFPSGEEALTE